MTSFRTRARAVEMLGRQQIASLPTAISELFKNAHDAYARTVTAEFFRTSDLLVVHDDGIGMSRSTFEDRWLTIATESRFDAKKSKPPSGMKARSPLGEKGIGRFAIGALGGQVLVVSKQDDLSGVAALVNWEMFEIPGLDLDEIPVGLLDIASSGLTPAAIRQLKKPLLKGLDGFAERDFGNRWNKRIVKIRGTVESFPEDPYAMSPGLTPFGSGDSGTHFFISPVSENLIYDIEPSDEDGRASALNRTLHGFTDHWLGDGSTQDFSVEFIDHRSGGDSESLLEDEDFFSPTDFGDADHGITGRFMSDGTFRGQVRVFDNDPMKIEIDSPLRSDPRCGPFDFQLGAVQGQASESRLAPESYADLNRRLVLHGGLYVYMDGVRVQPYGRPDVDYLEIEERRSRGAAYYYFSYRRIFGAVRLDASANSALEEKAGREGFSQGRAYADFRRLLINLFQQLAARFFRSDGSDSAAFEAGRERLKAEDRLRRERERRTKEGRLQLGKEIASAVEFVAETDLPGKVEGILATARAEAELATRLQPATRALAEATARLQQLLAPLTVNEPEGFAPTEAMRRDLAFLESEQVRLLEDLIGPALDAVALTAQEVEDRLIASEVDTAEREEWVNSQLVETRAAVHGCRQRGGQALENLVDRVGKSLAETSSDFDDSLAVLGVPDADSSAGWVHEQASFESELRALKEEALRSFSRLERHISASRLVFESGAASSHDLAGAADAEILELRARADAQLELVQLGMALAVVDHEFRATISSLRSDVRRVRTWARKNPGMVGLYEDLRRDFDHLDSYLTLLTPLQRRVRRSTTTIRGVDLARFLGELFDERTREASVEIVATPSFKDLEVEGYASTFYPVFINLVDNSLYWFESSDMPSPRRIELDTRGRTILYSDNGPGIDQADADRVFEFGFSTRPGGSGLGLAIAEQVLHRAGWDIYLSRTEPGVRFVLSPARESE